MNDIQQIVNCCYAVFAENFNLTDEKYTRLVNFALQKTVFLYLLSHQDLLDVVKVYVDKDGPFIPHYLFENLPSSGGFAGTPAKTFDSVCAPDSYRNREVERRVQLPEDQNESIMDEFTLIVRSVPDIGKLRYYFAAKNSFANEFSPDGYPREIPREELQLDVMKQKGRPEYFLFRDVYGQVGQSKF